MSAPTTEEIERAIAIVETSRATHVDWKAWQDRTPDWREWVKKEPESPGTPEHHEEVIAEYDHVLSVLRNILPEKT